VELSHSRTTNLRHNGFKTRLWGPEASRPGHSGWKMNMDTGGCISDAKDYVEGCGIEDEYNPKMRARKAGTHYSANLTPHRQRTWHVTELDIIVVALKSDKDRCRIMAQANPIAGSDFGYVQSTDARSNQRTRCARLSS
jgi:hypothetical protein